MHRGKTHRRKTHRRRTNRRKSMRRKTIRRRGGNNGPVKNGFNVNAPVFESPYNKELNAKAKMIANAKAQGNKNANTANPNKGTFQSLTDGIKSIFT
jgi:hypothetical protein